jgi:two-component system sensor histidine kinase DctS
MVEQVLLNLARNGLQAMESDRSDHPTRHLLTLRVRQVDARWVEFSVIDTGPGIPAEVAQQLFTPFFTTKAEGMGIGLAMCRTVLEQHGGALDFNSPVPGAGDSPGTAFRFTLPAAGTTPPVTAPDEPAAAPAVADSATEPAPTALP